MKRFSTSLVITEMQIKTTLRFHFTPIRMSIIKKTGNNKCRPMWRNWNHQMLLVGMQNDATALGSNLPVSQNIRQIYHISKRKERIVPHKNLHINIHNNIIYSRLEQSGNNPHVHQLRKDYKMWFTYKMKYYLAM